MACICGRSQVLGKTARQVEFIQAVKDWAVGIIIGIAVFGAAALGLVEVMTFISDHYHG